MKTNYEHRAELITVNEYFSYQETIISPNPEVRDSVIPCA